MTTAIIQINAPAAGEMIRTGRGTKKKTTMLRSIIKMLLFKRLPSEIRGIFSLIRETRHRPPWSYQPFESDGPSSPSLFRARSDFWCFRMWLFIAEV